ncbi:MAG: fibronectin type III domain-containing protein, partial [Schleiferiaceae bacterium]
MKFSARTLSTSSFYSNKIYVGVSDSAGSTGSITVVDTIDLTLTSHSIYSVDLTTASGVGTGDSRVVFMMIGDGSAGYAYIDDVIIRVKNTCADITNLAASTTATGIGVSWDGSSTHTSYTVEYDTAGFVPGTGMSVTVTTDTAHLTGLTSTTQYDIYVNGVCSSTSSGYSTKTSAFSPCGAVTAGWTEGFESASNGSSSNPSLPNCWDDYNSGTFGSYHYTYGSTGNTGSKSLRIYTSSSTSYTL